MDGGCGQETRRRLRPGYAGAPCLRRRKASFASFSTRRKGGATRRPERLKPRPQGANRPAAAVSGCRTQVQKLHAATGCASGCGTDANRPTAVASGCRTPVQKLHATSGTRQEYGVTLPPQAQARGGRSPSPSLSFLFRRGPPPLPGPPDGRRVNAGAASLAGATGGRRVNAGAASLAGATRRPADQCRGRLPCRSRRRPADPVPEPPLPCDATAAGGSPWPPPTVPPAAAR